MVVGVWMLVGAIVIDVFGVGNRKWAAFIAGWLAVGGFLRVLAPSKLGSQLQSWAEDLAAMAGQAMSNYDPEWGRVITSIGVAAVATVVIIVWFFMLMPKSTPQAGEAAKKDLNSAWLWGGAAVAAVFVAAIPGPLGEFFTGVIGFGARLAGDGAANLTSLGSLTEALTFTSTGGA